MLYSYAKRKILGARLSCVSAQGKGNRGQGKLLFLTVREKKKWMRKRCGFLSIGVSV